MGVFVRSENEIERARAAVVHAALPYKVHDEHVETISGQASICTMHLAKGLEFRAVAVMACDDEIIPLQSRIETVAETLIFEHLMLYHLGAMAPAPKKRKPAKRPAFDWLVKMFDPMTPLTAQNANVYLSPPKPNLATANEGDPDFIPYEIADDGERFFRLGDVLTAQAGDPNLHLEGSGPWIREQVEESMANRVGPRPAWLDSEHYQSAEEKKKSDEGWNVAVNLLGPVPNVNKKSLGRPARVISPAAGGRLHRITFSSLGDFVLNALPDDIWIVAKPPYGRPYDFLDSLAAEDGAPWQTMTLIEYLDAIRAGARQEEAAHGEQGLRRHIKKKS